MKKYFLCILLLSVVSVNAQQNDKLFTDSNMFWLKKKTITDNNNLGARSGKDSVTLNFHQHLRFNEDKIKQKNASLLNHESSLFIVFKSATEDEIELMQFGSKLDNNLLTNKKLITQRDNIFHESNAKTGSLITHIFTKNSLLNKKKGHLNFLPDLVNESESVNTLFEVLYFPKALAAKEQSIIESYLSIKYGISLIGTKDYTNSKGDTIWNYRRNSNYSTRVTGIGRDDVSSLYQRQSGNAEKDGLYIGLQQIKELNSKNHGELLDKTFFLWGDNGLKAKIDEKATVGLAQMERVWKTNKASGDSIITQIMLNKKQMGIIHQPDSKKSIWLVRDTLSSQAIDFVKAEYIQASSENDSLIFFDKVKWKNETSLFTFSEAPEFFATFSAQTANCRSDENDGIIDVMLKGGMSPFAVKLYNGTILLREVTTNENFLRISNLANASYSIQVKDKNGDICNGDILLDPIPDSKITLPPKWYMEHNSTVRVIPDKNDAETFIYRWFYHDKPVATGAEFIAEAPGQYMVEVQSAKGCVKTLPFEVIGLNSEASGRIRVYPNPCKANQSYHVAISNDAIVATSVTITDLHGKIIDYRNMGVVQNCTYDGELSQAATYIIIVKYGSQEEIAKIVIH